MKNEYITRLIWLFVLLISIPASAYDFESGDIYYNISSGQVYVTHGDSEYKGDIVIPSQVTYYGRTYKVFSIGGQAFANCNSLTSVSIPNSVISIEIQAFWQCYNLRSITIPQSVSYIGEYAFSGCGRLNSIVVDSNNRYYDSRNNCNAIIETNTNKLIAGCKNTIIPSNVESIADNSFSHCRGLVSITIPSSVKYIGSQAFFWCNDLTNISIHDGIISVGSQAFYNTAWLNNQPDGLVYIGKVLYAYNGEIPENTHISIKDGTLVIADGAFDTCRGLTSIKIPSSVKYIGYEAFKHTTSLASIAVDESNQKYDSRNNCNAVIETSSNTLIAGCKNTKIPNSITSIGNSAFLGCNELDAITIPNSVTSIGEGAFFWCEKLMSVTLPNHLISIGRYAFFGCSSLTSVTIPNSVTSIGWHAFEDCKGLTFVTIPNSVTSIGSCTFRGCSGLTTIISEIEKPFVINSNIFTDDTYINAELKVPKGTKSAYQTIEGWNKFTKVTEITNGGDGIKVELEALSYSREYGEANPVFDYKVNVKEGEQFLWNGSETYGESWSLRNIDITSGMGLFNSGDRLRFYATNIGVNAWMTIVIGDTMPYVVDGTFPTDGSSYLEVVIDEEIASQLNSHVSGGKITFQIQGRYFTLESISKCMSFELNGEPTIFCEATVSSPVGTYPIKISKGSITNDNVTYVDGTLTITKAPLTITAKNYSREQGQANPNFEVTYSGFKNGENESVLTRMPTVSTTATASSPSGTYDIEVSGAEAQNYSFIYNKGVLTVTEKDEVAFTVDGITYQGSKSEKTVMVKSVDTGKTWMEIPVSVSNDGTTYQVTGIADDAFKGCSGAALIWNVEAALPNNAFNNASIGSNFLLYVKSSSYAPSSVKNVVVNGTAQTIVLSDDGGQFYCPQAFKAGSISYTHNYSMETGGEGKGWETIALPFDVQKISHSTRGEIVPFPAYSSGSNQKPFWLGNMSASGFKRAWSIQAYEPYIIAMPNNSKYNNDYNLAGDVTFSAENVQVGKTPTFSGLFLPAFETVPQSSTVYALNVNNRNVKYTGSYDVGSRFISNLRDVRPFEAYINTSSTRGIIEINYDDGTTGMDAIMLTANEDSEISIYTLSGLQVARTTQRYIDTVWQQLPKGVYIVNGRKMIK